MKKKRLIGIITILLNLCFLATAFAEIIMLKSGERIEGKIIERTEKYIKIDFCGVPISCYFEDIESIDEERPVSSFSTFGNSNVAKYYMRETSESVEVAEDSVDKASKSGSLIFRVSAANPSAKKTQTVPIKAYLPVEIKAEDILDNGGLKSKYDSKKSMYYLYKEV
jgi:hypothetical protein